MIKSKKLLLSGLLIVACVAAAVYFFYIKKPSVSSPSQVAQSAKTQAQSLQVDSDKKALPIPAPPDDSAAKEAISEIRRELYEVMQLNEAINLSQNSKSQQLLKIQEQAGIHRKILSNIEQLSDMKSDSIPSREALLTQEKLRVIREETLRNKKTLEEIQLGSKTS